MRYVIRATSSDAFRRIAEMFKETAILKSPRRLWIAVDLSPEEAAVLSKQRDLEIAKDYQYEPEHSYE